MIYSDVAPYVAAGDVNKIVLLTEGASKEECAPQQIIAYGCTATLRHREQYSAGQIFPPAMLMACLAVSALKRMIIKLGKANGK